MNTKTLPFVIVVFLNFLHSGGANAEEPRPRASPCEQDQRDNASMVKLSADDSSQQRRRQPRRAPGHAKPETLESCPAGNGNGLLTATGVVAGLSWAAWATRVALVKTDTWRKSPSDSYSKMAFFVMGHPEIVVTNWSLMVGTLVLAPLAGQRRGRYDAHFRTFPVSQKLRSRRFIAAGGALLAVGVYLDLMLLHVSKGARSIFAFPRMYSSGFHHLDYYDLNYFGVAGFTLGQFNMASIAAGSGLLMYGLESRRETRILKQMRVGVYSGGFSVFGRF